MTREWRGALAWFGAILVLGGLVLGLLPLPGDCGRTFSGGGLSCKNLVVVGYLPWVVLLWTFGTGLLVAAYAAQFLHDNPPPQASPSSGSTEP
ncbi:hypothetical protein JOF53_006195 [Crossiella equi]|uniref:DUF3311 domain-containing protein n=1 Tax=Crossiella equi TaxID=130796 RepID=A0ABS5AL85_9PSEU|nr:hypothetical protein [Crossiella equi]MBP2477323.1 hypothetical protein [Crossiella equi]